ncbi:MULTISPECIES: EAL domain-containing protein [unclassified Synechocystis]|uniref:bifunctional diguanylate cyclase/phosphodiesterase n=1 Tax=unclassified Synechocystis TaxID=2640012 RepID=UPI0004208314|nr:MULTISPECIES: EAL domain-containing protein [unclassified Synechocystis]AIE74821.1 diguanylate cyclase/phosphodiesterase (GGDEF & EAL domains) with PAS/PAC sensor(s) [Synechocystis sp. PCC 6714]
MISPPPSSVAPHQGRTFWRGFVLFSLIFFIILGGFAVARWRMEMASQRIRQQLLNQVEMVSLNLNFRLFQELSFTGEDLGNPSFQRLHNQIAAYAQTFHNHSFYTMVMQSGRILFGPDSLKSGDFPARAPGAIYENPPEVVRKLFDPPPKKTVIGPYHSGQGSFVSAYAPILQPRSEKVLVIVAIDMEASQWYKKLRRKVWGPLLFSMGLIVLVLGGDYLLQERRRWGNSFITNQGEGLVTAIIGLFLTLALTMFIHENASLNSQRNFSQLAIPRANLFAQRLWELQNYGLSSLNSFIESSEEVTRAEFTRFTLPMIRKLSIQAWEWIPKVTASDKENFERKAREDGLKNFQIFELDRRGKIVPARGREVYYPIFYAEPLAGNEMALGFDVSSNESAKIALDEALESGLASATNPLTLIQELGNQRGIVAYSPVFAGHNLKNPPMGVAAVVLRLNEFLTQTFGEISFGDKSLELQWLQLSVNQAPLVLASSSPPPFSLDDWQENKGIFEVYPLFVFGKAYALLLSPGPEFNQKHPDQVAMIAFGVGTGITILVTIIVAIITNSQANLTHQIRQRTKELRATLGQLRERIKEMDCLVAIAQMAQQSDLVLDEFLQNIVDLLPQAFHYEKLASARLTWGNSLYQTPNYQKTDCCLTVDFQTDHIHRGQLEVCYSQGRDFLPEEKALLNTIGQFLSRFLESHYTEIVLERNERNYREIFNSTHEAIFIQDIQTGIIIDVNQSMLSMYGYGNKEEVIGRPIRDFSVDQQGQTEVEINKKIRQVRTSELQIFEWLAQKQNGHVFWVEISIRPTVIDGKARLLAVVRDISERKRSQRRIEYLSRLYATLSQVNQAIIENRGRDELFRAICDVGVEIGEFPLVWFGLIDPDSRAIVPYIVGGDTTAYLDNIHITARDEPSGQGPSGTAVREGRLVICSDISQDPRMVPWRSNAMRYGFLSSASVPIWQDHRVVAVLTFYSREVDFFTEDEQDLLQEIGDNISFALNAIQSDQAHQLAQQQLAENEERLRLALEAANQGFYDLNLQTGQAVVSPQYVQILGYDPDHFHETEQNWLERIHPQDRKAVEGIYRNYIQGEISHYEVECRQLTMTGQWKWLLSLGKIVEWDPQGKPLRMLGILTDITERKRAEAQIEVLAYYDPLTGLPNRRLLLDRAENALALAQRSEHYGAIALIDLDGFKTLNDARGHDSGDRLLQMVAERLQDNLRDSDTVARLGGDEFVVLLPELAHDRELAARLGLSVGEKIRRALATPFSLEAEEVQISGSIGITLFPKLNEKVNDLFKEADTAMYQAKKAGRNKVCLFESQMQLEVESRFALEADLRHALEQKQFQVYLQPQVDSNGIWIGAEALLRWNHPSQGFIPPNVFIPIAEEIGLIYNIGNFVLEQVCQYLARLQPLGSSLRIAVNVSPRQFRQPHFAKETKTLLDSTGVDPYRLTLEVTEGLIVEDTHQAIATMFELQTLGVHFSVDDFGTGYSSLAYLKRLPLNELKIDRAFVQDVPQDLNNAALVEAIISVAHTFNLAIVAEGVETKEQVQFLAQLGCNVYQGYFYGRPMPIDEFHQKLTAS